MSWENKPNSGFSNEGVKTYYKGSQKLDKINMNSDLSSKEKSIYNFTRELIKLRKGSLNEFLTDFDKIDVIKLEKDYTIFKNTKNNESIYVSINWSDKAKKITRDIKEVLFSNYQTKQVTKTSMLPFEATIYKAKR